MDAVCQFCFRQQKQLRPQPLGLVLPLFWAGIISLGVNYGAYMTEIFRAGIQAVPPGHCILVE